MSRYTFLFADLRTNAILAELPLKGMSFTHELNGAGSWSASLPLGDAKVSALDPLGSTQPARTAIYVDRDGSLLYGGIVWSRRWSSGGSLELSGSQLWSYYKRRRIMWNLDYVQQDQLFIAREILYEVTGPLGADIGLQLGTETSGVLRDRSYKGYEYKPVAEAIEQLSAVENGFDFAIDVAYVGNVPTKTFKLNYPRRGTLASVTGHMFEYPGNISGYTWPEDGGSQANVVHGIGEGEADAMLRVTVQRPDLIDAGYPFLEDVVSHKDVSVYDTLDGHVRSALADSAEPVVIPQITVRADMDPVLGSYIIGDDVRLRITDARFPATLDTYMRIIGMTVRTDPESVDLTLGAA